MKYLLFFIIVSFAACNDKQADNNTKLELDKTAKPEIDAAFNSIEAMAKGGSKGKPSTPAAIAAFNISMTISGNTVAWQCNGFTPKVVLMLHGNTDSVTWTTTASHPLSYSGAMAGSYTYNVFGQSLMLAVGYTSLIRIYAKDTNDQHQASEAALLIIQ